MRLQICTFVVNGQHIGMQIDAVREIIVDMPIRPVPLAGSEVRGLMNLRGQIIMVIDFRAIMGYANDGIAGGKSHILVGEGGKTISLLVDEIGDIIEIDTTMCDVPPSTLSEKNRKLFTAVYTDEKGDNVLIVNKEIALSSDLLENLCAQQ